MSDVREVAAALAGEFSAPDPLVCEECDERHTSKKAAMYCAERDRAEDAEDRRFLRSSN